MSQPISLRLQETTISRLGVRAERIDLKPRTLAQRYVEEGLRMDEHPLVRFVDGPAGRRASLVGSIDVWEAIEVIRENDNDVTAASEYLQVPAGLLQAAVAYYGAYQDEVDAWIERNRQEMEDAHAAFLAGQAALAQ